MADVVISVHNFRKTYGTVVAVEDVTFEVFQGEIFGLLGPNGAGKTTTLESLEGIRKSDSGLLRILGVDPERDVRRLDNLIGVQLQTSGLPANMTVEEAMRFFCAYHDAEPSYGLLDRLGLGEKRRSQYHQLSTGQQRRLALALAVAHNPPVIILDEPTAGLDVASRTELHQIMQEQKEQGVTILLATHDMAEAEKMTDRVAILLNGKVLTVGTPRELTATGSGYTKVSVRTEADLLINNQVEFPCAEKSLVKEEYAIFFSTDPGPTVTAILDYIKEQADRLVDLRVERPSLEERFLELTNTGGSQ